MTSAFQEIEALAQIYFDAIYDGDVRAIDLLFHPDARLFCVGGGSETILGVSAYKEIVAGRTNPRDRGDPRADEILSIETPTATTALLRTRELFLPKRFTDDLGLVRWPEGWRIVSKIWDFELLQGGLDE